MDNETGQHMFRHRSLSIRRQTDIRWDWNNIPNPADIYTSRIIFKNDDEKEAVLFIYDALGRYIYKSGFEKTNDFSLTDFFRNDRYRGIYYFEIKNKELKTISNGSFVY